jgi:neutral/alkaline ceramidase-like enzyme/hemolysin type calcium-binding protein
MRRLLGGIVAAGLTVAAALAAGAPATSPADTDQCAPPTGDQVCAGVGTVDASWHVGASAGQYASDGSFVDPENGSYDPAGHSTRRRSSYGIQSRLSARAIVVQDPDSGERFALVKNDFYIPQDLVYRRAAQIVAEDRPDLGIDATNMTMAVTHNHNSPFYASSSWGVWTFQDVFDVRFFEYMAHRMAEAVEMAADDLRPVRVGAAVVDFDKTHRHSYGPAIADDGTPAGYPKADSVHDVTVIRFDDVSDPADPEPFINLLNWGQHPESLNGNDLISADYLGPLERMLDRETGATTLFTQGAVGTAEPERSEWHSVHERLEFSHREYAQAEFGARLIANAAEQAADGVEQCGAPGGPARCVPFGTDLPVEFADHWYPGPLTHPYPTVSNCRADSGLAGDPLLPIVGLPDCEGLEDGLNDLADLVGLPGPGDIPFYPIDPGLSTDDFQAAGIPVPENYGAPSYTGLQEDIDVHLQAFRLGDILFTVCPCEEFKDQWQNIVTRTDTTNGNEYVGFDWSTDSDGDPDLDCTQEGNGSYSSDGSSIGDGSGTGTWSCPNPQDVSGPPLTGITDLKFNRFRAQVRNDAAGWNNLENVLSADSEPADPTQIKGNFTHDDTHDDLGYELTVPMAMGNDYNGYIPPYREFQRGDHYRKALAGWGPHSSDYMATRLVTLGRLFKDPGYTLPPDQVTESAYDPKVQADLAVNEQRAEALGDTGGAAIAAYEASLPDDGGNAEVVTQPQDIERFGAALFTWNGGSNFTDNPQVRVELETAPGVWEDYADQSGEIPVTLAFPQGENVASYTQGDQRWHWTADFEAFVAGYEDQTFNTGDRDPVTPAGTYRFVVHGQRRDGGQVVDYDLTSDEFQVSPWQGILVQDFNLEPDGTMSFSVGPTSTYNDVVGGCDPPVSDQIGPIDYPDSYAGSDPRVARFIRNERQAFPDPADRCNPDQIEWFCLTCTFRPWVDFGDAQSAQVTITLTDDATELVSATKQPNGRWRTQRALQPGESAQVLGGGVLDSYGNTNEPSGILSKASTPPLDSDGDGVLDTDDQCPAEAGPPSNGGCPITPPPPDDGDGDGVPDAADQCPQTPGPIDGFGCPPSPPGSGLPIQPTQPVQPQPANCETRHAGTPGGDSLLGTLEGDLLLGLRGGDRIRGSDGPDCVFGGRGKDFVDGEAGDDLVRGGDGRDLARGGAGADVVSGGRGRDRIKGGDGDDALRAVDGDPDRLNCGLGADRARIGPGDRTTGCERVKRIRFRA